MATKSAKPNPVSLIGPPPPATAAPPEPPEKSRPARGTPERLLRDLGVLSRLTFDPGSEEFFAVTGLRDVAQFIRERVTADDQYRALVIESARVREQLTEDTKRIAAADLTATVDRLGAQVVALEARMGEATRELETLTADRDRLRAEVAAAESRLIDAQAALAALRAKFGGDA